MKWSWKNGVDRMEIAFTDFFPPYCINIGWSSRKRYYYINVAA